MRGSVDLFYVRSRPEREPLGPDLITEKVKLIQQRIQTAHSCQKSYADPKRKHLEFDVENRVFLKVSPMKGVMRFGRKDKLSPR